MSNNSYMAGSSPANLPGQAPSSGSPNLNGLLDVNAPSPSDNQVLGWDSATQRWIAFTLDSSSANIINFSDLGDVNVASPSNNQLLLWDSGSNRWVNETFSLANIGSTSINDLDDVHLTNPSVGQIMRWSGTRWEQSNTAPSALGVYGVDASANGTYYGKDDGGRIGFHSLPVYITTLNSLEDVSAVAPGLNHVLSWNGTTWVDVENSAANTTFDDANVSYSATTVQEALEASAANVVVGDNLLINGDFSVWQRSTTYTNQHHPSVDRWRRWSAVMDTMDRVDVTDAGIGAVYAVRTRRTTAGDHGIIQRIESFRAAVATGNITVSFWAKVDSGSGTPSIFIGTADEKDDWSSASSVLESQVGLITTTWQRFAFTLDVTARSNPASNGMLIGIACNSGTVACEFANVKVEIGDVATPFVAPHPADNLLQCQRYYFAIADYNAQEANATAGGQFFSDYIMFPTTMRISPALSLVSETLVNCNVPNFGSTSPTGFRRQARSAAAGRCIIADGTYNADAEL